MIDDSWYRRVTDVPERLAAGGVVVRLEGDEVYVALTEEHEPAFDVLVLALPKGGVERGESVLDAARREVLEETGLDALTLLQQAPLVIEERYGLRKDLWLRTTWFLFATSVRDAQPTEANHSLRWAPLSDLPPLFWPSEARLLRAHKDAVIRATRAGQSFRE